MYAICKVILIRDKQFRKMIRMRQVCIRVAENQLGEYYMNYDIIGIYRSPANGECYLEVTICIQTKSLDLFLQLAQLLGD